jgi:hypothetical protein
MMNSCIQNSGITSLIGREAEAYPYDIQALTVPPSNNSTMTAKPTLSLAGWDGFIDSAYTPQFLLPNLDEIIPAAYCTYKPVVRT